MVVSVALALGSGGVVFHKNTDPPPHANAWVLPWLIGYKPIRKSARVGHISGIGSTEVPNTEVVIDNAAGQASTLFEFELPLGRQMIIFENQAPIFSGQVFSLDIGATLIFQVEM